MHAGGYIPAAGVCGIGSLVGRGFVFLLTFGGALAAWSDVADVGVRVSPPAGSGPLLRSSTTSTELTAFVLHAVDSLVAIDPLQLRRVETAGHDRNVWSVSLEEGISLVLMRDTEWAREDLG